MNYRIWKIVFVTFVLFGCTQKANIVGSGINDNPEPVTVEFDQNYFSRFVSYEDSIGNGNSDILVVGKYDSNGSSNEAFSLIKFSALPDTFHIVENVRLSLELRNEDQFEPVNLKIGKVISQNWNESEADYYFASDSVEWNGNNFDDADFEPITDITITENEDSLSISLPAQIVQNWITADSLNYGIVLYSEENDGFLNFYASEYSTEEAPQLLFDFQETEEDTLFLFNQVADSDVSVFSTDDEFTIFEGATGRIIISNVQPVRSYMKFELPDSIFLNAVDYDVEDPESFMQQISISKAEIILNSTEDNYISLDDALFIDPYLVISDSLDFDDTSVPAISAEDIEDPFISNSFDVPGTLGFKVDITKIVQSYISGEYENNGIMLRSIYENKNFLHDEFKTDDIQISVVFVPPFTSE